MGLRQSNDLSNSQLSLPKLPQNILDPTFCHVLAKIIFQKHSTCFKPLPQRTGSNILVPSMPGQGFWQKQKNPYQETITGSGYSEEWQPSASPSSDRELVGGPLATDLKVVLQDNWEMFLLWCVSNLAHTKKKVCLSLSWPTQSGISGSAFEDKTSYHFSLQEMKKKKGRIIDFCKKWNPQQDISQVKSKTKWKERTKNWKSRVLSIPRTNRRYPSNVLHNERIFFFLNPFVILTWFC